MIKHIQSIGLAILALTFTGIANAQAAESSVQKFQGSSVKCPSGIYTAPAKAATSGGITTLTFFPSQHDKSTNEDATCLQNEIAKKLNIHAPSQITCKLDSSVRKGAIVCRIPQSSLPK